MIKNKTKSVFRSLKKLVYTTFGLQLLEYPIGRVKVPHSTRHFLKKSVAQQGEDLVLDRIITRILDWNLLEPRIYVDVGAYHAIDHSVTYLLYQRGWKGIVFDPSEATKKTFRKWRPRDVFVQSVVGDKDGEEVDFYFPKSGKDASLINSKYPEDASNCRMVRFKQVCIDDELLRQGIHEIDVLNIDVEGAELEILNTFNFEKYTPAVIIIEMHGNNILQSLESDEAKILFDNNYILVACTVITFFFIKKHESQVHG